jgi:DNA-binding beta-propeller fold protein YncE
VAAPHRIRPWIVSRLIAVVCLTALISGCGGSGESTIDRTSSGGQETFTNAKPSGDQVVEHATVVRVDAATGAVKAVVPVGPDPLLLSVASGRIWTLNLGDGTLSRVEPSSNEARTIRRGTVVGIASGIRDLWIARDGNVVSRLDGASGQTEISFVLGPKPLFALRDAGFLGVGPKSVWLTVPRVGEPSKPHTLWRLDPNTGMILGKLPLGHDVLPPLVDDRYLWIIAMGERSVTRIDQRSGETADVPAGPLPLALAAGAGSLWLGDESGEVWRINPKTLKVTAKINVGGRLRRAGFGGGLVWVTTETGLLAIDPATNRVTMSVALGDFERDTGPTDIGYLGGSVWVSVE